MSEGASLLECDALSRRTAAGDWLLREISLRITSGERLGIAGPTGSGKTVLLRSLVSLDPADQGEMRHQGDEVTPGTVVDLRSQVIYVAQHPAFLPGSVESNLQLPFSLAAHQRRSYSREESLIFLQAFDRSEAFLAQDVDLLSGGERQVVAMLRAIQLRPRVLLLDEPTAAMDVSTTRAAESAVAAWFAADERAYVWVSHDDEQLARMTDRVVRLSEGQVA